MMINFLTENMMISNLLNLMSAGNAEKLLTNMMISSLLNLMSAGDVAKLLTQLADTTRT